MPRRTLIKNIPLVPPSKGELRTTPMLVLNPCRCFDSQLLTIRARREAGAQIPPLKGDQGGCSSRRSPGFTLIELIVVMTFIALLTAAVIPLYQGSLTRVRQDRATRDFVAYLKYAQERAITDGTEYRFYFREDERDYWVMRLDKMEGKDKIFVYPDEGAGEIKHLPEGIEFDRPKARFDRDREAHFVAFYGTGACDYATIKFETSDDKRIVLETKGRLGRFEVKEK